MISAMDDDDSVLRTPAKGMLDDSGLDSLIETSTSLRIADDSLADVLKGAPEEPEAPGPAESAEQVNAQLHELRQLNTLFESYEVALSGGIAQVEVRTSANRTSRSGSTRRTHSSIYTSIYSRMPSGGTHYLRSRRGEAPRTPQRPHARHDGPRSRRGNVRRRRRHRRCVHERRCVCLRAAAPPPLAAPAAPAQMHAQLYLHGGQPAHNNTRSHVMFRQLPRPCQWFHRR